MTGYTAGYAKEFFFFFFSDYGFGYTLLRYDPDIYVTKYTLPFRQRPLEALRKSSALVERKLTPNVVVSGGIPRYFAENFKEKSLV